MKIETDTANGRSGKHGTYNPRHNDRRFDVENSEHIMPASRKCVLECYRGFTNPLRENPEQPDFTLKKLSECITTSIIRTCDAQNARNEKTRHTERTARWKTF